MDGSISLYVDDAKIIPESVSYRESVFDYSFVLTFISQFPVTTRAVSCDVFGTRCDFTVVSMRLVDSGRFEYVCYPTPYMTLLNTLSPSVLVSANLEGICSTLGVPYVSVYPTLSCQWTLPRMKGRVLMDTLTWGASSPNGGCSTFHFRADGKCEYSDLLLLSATDGDGVFSGSLQSQETSRTFMSEFPGIIDFYFYNEDSVTVKERVVFAEGFGIGSWRQYLNSSDMMDYYIRKARNQFWRNVFNASRLTFKNVTGALLRPGSRVRWAESTQSGGVKEDLVVLSLEATYNDGAVDMQMEAAPLVNNG